MNSIIFGNDHKQIPALEALGLKPAGFAIDTRGNPHLALEEARKVKGIAQPDLLSYFPYRKSCCSKQFCRMFGPHLGDPAA